MKTDAEIEADVARLTPVVGPTHAGWYAEACKVGYDAPPEAVLLACRVREAVRVHGRDLGELAGAAEKLLAACSRLDEGGGERVRAAAEEVQKALWWRDQG